MRDVNWDGLHNARDLGGVGTPTGDTMFGAVFRSPNPLFLSELGAQQLVADGVRTVIDLRNDGESATFALPEGISRSSTPLEDQSDRDFMANWGGLLHSPEYYPEVLRRWPELVVAVFRAIAEAPDGGVLVHCGGGRDRTGLIVAMLLSLVGADEEAIVDDYVAGVRAANAFLFTLEQPHEPPLDEEQLDARIAMTTGHLRAFVESLDVEAYLLEHGMTHAEVEAIRARLLPAAPAGRDSGILVP